MQQFTDEQGRTWKLKATTNALKRILEGTGIDLQTLLDDKSVVGKALSDSMMFVAMLFAWCEPQADQAGVTPEQFGELIYGDTFDSAMIGFQTELPLFFPSQRRTIVARLIRRYQTAEQASTDRSTKLIDGPIVDDLLTKLLDRGEQRAIAEMYRCATGEDFTSSPASLELTPEN